MCNFFPKVYFPKASSGFGFELDSSPRTSLDRPANAGASQDKINISNHKISRDETEAQCWVLGRGFSPQFMVSNLCIVGELNYYYFNCDVG